MKILIADDHPIVGIGLSELLKDHFENLEIDTLLSLKGIEQQIVEKQYDIIILDFNMPGGNSFERIQHIKSLDSHARVIVFSSYPASTHAHFCLQNGADGYVCKDLPESRMLVIFQKILSKDDDTSDIPELHGNTAVDKNISKLSARELEVMDLLVAGNGLLEISNLLSISVSSANTYKRRIFNKFNIHNVVELVSLYKSLNVSY